MAIDMSQFYQVFFEESAEHLAAMESLLLELDIDSPDMEQLNAIFRAAHSIKGSAGTFGFTDLAESTHILENLVDRIRKEELALRAEMVDAFLEAGDVLRTMLEAHQGRADEDGLNIAPTQGFIGTQAANSTLAPLFRSYPPSPSPERYFPSLDILTSGGINNFEPLPNVPRALNFNVSMRDNNPSGGAVANDNVTITVMNAVPMNVVRPVGRETLQAGMSEQITWATNGSGGLCQKV